MSKQDDVRGIVVGDILVGWQLFYQGRPQSKKQYSTTSAQAELDAAEAKRLLLEELGGYPTYCYGDKRGWLVRIWD
jgi:hypothetical protein